MDIFSQDPGLDTRGQLHQVLLLWLLKLPEESRETLTLQLGIQQDTADDEVMILIRICILGVFWHLDDFAGVQKTI